MKIEPGNRAQFCAHIRIAVFHLTACREALDKAEQLAGAEINVESVRALSVDIDEPMDAYLISNSAAMGVEAYVRN